MTRPAVVRPERPATDDVALRSVCVVMPAYNAAATLPRAAASVLEQDYEALVLAISVYPDDRETIAAADAIDDDRVRVVRRDGRGIANARNSAIRAVDADLYMFLDSDDALAPGVVSAYVADVEEHPEPALRFADWTGISPVDGSMRRRVRAAPQRRQFESLLVDNFIATGTVMVDAAVLDEAGLFDESYDHAEDWELWLRIARRFPLRHLALNALFYTETKLDRVYPRSFFASERAIVDRQTAPRFVRTLASGLCRGRYGLYWLRTLRVRRGRDAVADVLPGDVAWAVLLIALRGWRVLSARGSA